MVQGRQPDARSPSGDGHPRGPQDTRYYLERLLTKVPLHRALLRAAECRLLSEHEQELARPILDLGTGDGSFAWVLFTEPPEVGIDPNVKALREARRLGAYLSLAVGTGASLPFRDGSFASVISNSTLEHIPDLEPVIAEMGRVLAPGGTAVITVPSERFFDFTFGVRLFRFLRLGPLANLYRRWIARVSRHYHCDPPAIWRERLAQADLSLLEWRYYFSSASTSAADVAHYISAPSLLTKRLLGRWVLWPGKVRLLPLARWLSPLAQPGPPATGGSLLLVCRKARPPEGHAPTRTRQIRRSEGP